MCGVEADRERGLDLEHRAASDRPGPCVVVWVVVAEEERGGEGEGGCQ